MADLAAQVVEFFKNKGDKSGNNNYYKIDALLTYTTQDGNILDDEPVTVRMDRNMNIEYIIKDSSKEYLTKSSSEGGKCFGGFWFNRQTYSVVNGTLVVKGGGNYGKADYTAVFK